jgi:hypothetical protein
MTFAAATAEAARRWGEGDHMFNVGNYHVVGQDVVERMDAYWRQDRPDNDLQYGGGTSWAAAFAEYDRRFP